jgi:dTDP-4-amino-4,6-dideoxygalactose transaminase
MDAVLSAIVEDQIGPGEQAQRLIQIAKENLNFDFCLALRSPAMALHFALRALNLEAGQGVLVSALSPRYYKTVIEELGLTPVYVDTAPGAAYMSPETVEAACTREGAAQARCMVVHHTLGYAPDMEGLLDMGIPVIDDISQSYGTKLAETAEEVVTETDAPQSQPEPPRKIPDGVLTILGLEERDMLTAGGGALLYASTRRDAAVLRNYAPGQPEGLPPEYGLPDMNAAMAAVQFKETGRNREKRGEIAQAYIKASLRTRHKRFVQNEKTEYNNYAFPLILETGMKDVKAYAKRKEIAVESAFDTSLMGAGCVPNALCPESYSLSLRTVLFPLYPRLTGQEVEKVAKLIQTLP